MKRRIIFSLTLCFLAILRPNHANAVTPESIDDVKCFVAAVSLLQTPDNVTRAAAVSSALYYLGRLDGREPGLDLDKLLAQESQRLSPDNLRAELRRCGQTLTARSQMIKEIGQHLPK